MSRNYPSPLSVVIKGAVAGLAGTAAITFAMQRGPRIVEKRLGVSVQPQEGEVPAGTPDDPTGELADRVAEGVLHTRLDDETQAKAGQAIHWGYGAMWGVVYGIVQSTLRAPVVLHGAAFGSLVATIASTVVPAMGLAPAPTEQPKRVSAAQMINHLIYGWVVALTYSILTIRDD